LPAALTAAASGPRKGAIADPTALEFDVDGGEGLPLGELPADVLPDGELELGLLAAAAEV
jgi:hypothetical protein